MNEPIDAALTNDAEPLWDAIQVAKFLNCSRNWVYMRAEAGLLPHVRIGSLLRFEPATIRDFIRRERLSATGAVARAKAVRAHRAA